MKRIVTLAAGAITLLLVSGCTSLAPTYQRPAASVPADWPDKLISVQSASPDTLPVADVEWRTFFTNARLQHLIKQALDHNHDLRVAVLNIEKARNQYHIQRSATLPSIDATALGTAERRLYSVSGPANMRTNHEYEVTLGFAAYELDFFGRVRSLNDQALARFLATEEARRSSHISLIAEVASTFLTLAADAERLQLTQQTLKNQRDAYELTRRSFELGVASELDLRRAQTAVDAARVDVAMFSAQLSQDRNALDLLVGTSVSAAALSATLEELTAEMLNLQPGMPGEVLLRRPDVIHAEHQLRAATADIGVARAAFFPSIKLTAGAGTASDDLSNLFSSGSGIWSFLPQVTLPIFNSGRNQANLQITEIERDILVARYQQAIQVAFREVADALVLRSTINDRLVAQHSLTDASKTSYRLSEARYRQGIDSYLSVLDAQRALYSAQQNLIATRLLQATNLVTLYKVLGGGWSNTDRPLGPVADVR